MLGLPGTQILESIAALYNSPLEGGRGVFILDLDARSKFFHRVPMGREYLEELLFPGFKAGARLILSLQDDNLKHFMISILPFLYTYTPIPL
jgi:hypothetical protein